MAVAAGAGSPATPPAHLQLSACLPCCLHACLMPTHSHHLLACPLPPFPAQGVDLFHFNAGATKITEVEGEASWQGRAAIVP